MVFRTKFTTYWSNSILTRCYCWTLSKTISSTEWCMIIMFLINSLVLFSSVSNLLDIPGIIGQFPAWLYRSIHMYIIVVKMIVISQCFELIGKKCLFWVIIKYMYTTIQCNYDTNEDYTCTYSIYINIRLTKGASVSVS